MSRTLFIFSINVKTGEIEESVDKIPEDDDDFSSQNPFLLYDDDEDYVDYNGFAEDCVYVETYESSDWARKLAFDKVSELATQFIGARDFLFVNFIREDR